jgi:hypothetical protein
MQYLFLIWCISLLASGDSKKTDNIDYQQILHDLSGHWVGTGFTLIAVPSFTNLDLGFDLKLFHTHETLLFSGVREKIRNAGADEEVFLSSITYLQQITDITTNEELHIEPGIWFHQPASSSDSQPLLWRAGNIPHGNSFLAGSVSVKYQPKGGPVFENVTSFPFPQGFEDQIIFGGAYTAAYENPKLPATMLSKYAAGNVVVFPAQFLKTDIANQNICSTTTIEISSIEKGPGLGGVLNIPFLTVEANAAQVEATFYIEKVKNKDGTTFYQLQYLQEVYLDFPVLNNSQIITWPHISVATLRKQAGEYL